MLEPEGVPQSTLRRTLDLYQAPQGSLELLQVSWAFLVWQRLFKLSQAIFSNLFFDSFKQSFAQASQDVHVILGALPSGWNLGASAALNPKR